tara:strand:- start:2871 stop:3029 length:159 start_codon:yes stop_codon:yes gene_type:complete
MFGEKNIKQTSCPQILSNACSEYAKDIFEIRNFLFDLFFAYQCSPNQPQAIN